MKKVLDHYIQIILKGFDLYAKLTLSYQELNYEKYTYKQMLKNQGELVLLKLQMNIDVDINKQTYFMLD
jgi:hypothetical protein